MQINIDKMPKCLSVLIVGRIYQEDEVFKLIQKIITDLSHLVQTNVYFLDQKTLLKIQGSQVISTMKLTSYQVFNRQKDQKLINYIITIGGDGTILYSAKQFLNEAPPIISFQRGTLGFMCRFQQEQIQQVIQEIANHHISFSQSNVQKQSKFGYPFPTTTIMRVKSIQAKFNEKGEKIQQIAKSCINQVCISRKECQRIILQIWINKQKITETAGDGILISTPTGSTAYSLSAGGPIMSNGVNSILITPIAPNSLSFRPICLPSDCQIRIKLSTKSRSEGYISYDGQSNILFSEKDQIVITKSQHGITFLQPTDKMNKMPTWMQRLKFFLGWNEVFKYPECKIRK